MLIFLDIDEVLARYGKLQYDRIARLNRIIEACPSPARIVFNTSWNIYSLDGMQKRLTKAGFAYPKALHGQTGSTRGGGEPIREWLVKHNEVGTPFLILDDSTRDLGAMWCRLAHCRIGIEGLSEEVLQEALTILHRPISEATERAAALRTLYRHVLKVLDASWLTTEQKLQYAQEYNVLSSQLLQEPDFLKAAYLQG